jgi:hypothetical protein
VKPDILKIYDLNKIDEYFSKEAQNATFQSFVVYTVLAILVLSTILSISDALYIQTLEGDVLDEFVFNVITDYSFKVVEGNSFGASLINLFLNSIYDSAFSFFFYGIIIFVLSKLLGGKGTLLQQFYISSIIMIAFIPLDIFSELFSFIPYINCFSIFIVIAITIFSAFVHYKMISNVHKLNRTRSLIVVAILSVVVTAITGLYLLLSLIELVI